MGKDVLQSTCQDWISANVHANAHSHGMITLVTPHKFAGYLVVHTCLDCLSWAVHEQGQLRLLKAQVKLAKSSSFMLNKHTIPFEPNAQIQILPLGSFSGQRWAKRQEGLRQPERCEERTQRVLVSPSILADETHACLAFAAPTWPVQRRVLCLNLGPCHCLACPCQCRGQRQRQNCLSLCRPIDDGLWHKRAQRQKRSQLACL